MIVGKKKNIIVYKLIFAVLAIFLILISLNFFINIFSSVYKYFYNKSVSRDSVLQDEISKLKVENYSLRDLVSENQYLSQELIFKKKYNYRLLTAEIIGHLVDIDNDWFIIDIGSDEGLMVDMPVVSNGYLAGRLVKVTPSKSYFITILDSRFSTAIDFITGEKDFKRNNPAAATNGLLRGKHGLACEVEFISTNKQIKTGDMVITSGLEENIPRGLLIGDIISVDYNVNSLFQKAIIRPGLSINFLRIVSVLKP
ncbi:MAG: rod shape-determining protein MreC [Patescibacteria group bacterium]